MGKIFISYRRADSAAMCGRIYDRLVARFGRRDVFKDVDSIPLGVDFSQHIRDELRDCDVELVIIGRHWLDASDGNGRRLDDPMDYVRQEVEAALGSGILVVPLLVDGAAMPRADQLPGSLRPVILRNGLQVRYDPDFEGDMRRIIAHLEQARRPARGSPATRRSAPGHVASTPATWWPLAGASVAAVLFGILIFIWPGITARGLIAIFGAYALVDGIFSIGLAAICAAHHQVWIWSGIRGVVSIAAGLVAFMIPGIGFIWYLDIIATWAFIVGVSEVIEVIARQREIPRGWLNALSGALTAIFSIILVVGLPILSLPLLTLLQLIGMWAIIVGALHFAFAFRLRPLKGR